MARQSRPWFRFYVEAMRDPKMRRLTPAERWLWVAVLSAARESCIPGYLMVSDKVPCSWDDLADYAGMKLREVEAGTDKMHDLGMIDYDPDLDAWFLPAWADRQYESDTSAARTQKWRDNRRHSDADSDVTTLSLVTPPETETDTETERECAQGAPDPPKMPARGTRVPDPFDVSDPMVEWVTERCPGIDWARETEKFVNYWTAATGRTATKRDWTAAWRTWMFKADEYATTRSAR